MGLSSQIYPPISLPQKETPDSPEDRQADIWADGIKYQQTLEYLEDHLPLTNQMKDRLSNACEFRKE